MRSRRLVVKIGSSSLTHVVSGSLSSDAVASFAAMAHELRLADIDLVLVTSGAIASGFRAIGYAKRPSAVRMKQAAAAVGQTLLMQAYTVAFSAHGIVIGQVLLTRAELAAREAFDNAFATLDELLANDVVPIINENDSIATDELKFGDNDILSAYVAGLVHADMLAIITDTDGLYESDPRSDPVARRIPRVAAITSSVLAMASGPGSAVGTGGMRAKVLAAEQAIAFGVPVFVGIAASRSSFVDILAGQGSGTYFGEIETDAVSKRRQWIGLHGKPLGRLVVNSGAAQALVTHKRSLLAVGVREVRGDFSAAALVDVVASETQEIVARGLSQLAAAEIRAALTQSPEGRRGIEVINRDDLVLVGRGCVSIKEVLDGQLVSARSAWRTLCEASSTVKNHALDLISLALDQDRKTILDANQRDLSAARAEGMAPSVLDRLRLDQTRIDAILEGVRQVRDLPDPVGDPIETWDRPSGITISKVRVPIGIIGMVFESRPNVAVDSAVLCLKSGNCVLLRGSRTAIHSNRQIVSTLQRAIEGAGLPAACVQLFDTTDRADLALMLQQRSVIDLIIPRGGKELIELVCRTSAVPVLETGAGVCHVYAHADADVTMATQIIVNAKTQRPAVCNAAETFLVHEAWADKHLAVVVSALEGAGVACRGYDRSRAVVSSMTEATEADWQTEYLNLIISVKIVASLEEAIAHINRYGTRHSEAIVTFDKIAAETFQRSVDAAAVYHNCSTRFTDGFEFGFGAEIGISTQKLHARGPVGLRELTSYKFLISGNGIVRA